MDTIFTVYEKPKGNAVIIPMETDTFVLAPTPVNPIHHIVLGVIDRPPFSREAGTMPEILPFFRTYTLHPFKTHPTLSTSARSPAPVTALGYGLTSTEPMEHDIFQPQKRRPPE